MTYIQKEVPLILEYGWSCDIEISDKPMRIWKIKDQDLKIEKGGILFGIFSRNKLKTCFCGEEYKKHLEDKFPEQTVKKIDCDGKLNVDEILKKMTGMINDEELICNAVFEEVKEDKKHLFVDDVEAVFKDTVFNPLYSSEGKITSQGVYACANFTTPLNFKTEGYHFYSIINHEIKIVSESEQNKTNLRLHTNIKFIKNPEMYLLIRMDNENSKIFDIIRILSDHMPDETRKKSYESFDIVGYKIGENIYEDSPDLLKTMDKDGGIIIRREIRPDEIFSSAISKIKTSDTFERMKNIGLAYEPLIYHGNDNYTFA